MPVSSNTPRAVSQGTRRTDRTSAAKAGADTERTCPPRRARWRSASCRRRSRRGFSRGTRTAVRAVTVPQSQHRRDTRRPALLAAADVAAVPIGGALVAHVALARAAADDAHLHLRTFTTTGFSRNAAHSPQYGRAPTTCTATGRFCTSPGWFGQRTFASALPMCASFTRR